MGCGCAKNSRAEVCDIEDLSANQLSSGNFAGLELGSSRMGKKNKFMKEYKTESIVVESTTRRGERLKQPETIANNVVMLEHSALSEIPSELTYEVVVWNPNQRVLSQFKKFKTWPTYNL